MTVLPGEPLARCAWRYWARHRWQAVLLILGMAIGVAVVFAVDIANSSARRAMALSLDAVTGKTTHQITARGGVDEALYTRLRVQHGWRQLAPLVSDGVIARGEPFQLMGVDLFAEGAVRDQFIGGDGDASGRSLLQLMDFGSALIAGRTAARLGLARGDTLTIEWRDRNIDLEIIGVLGGAQQAAMDNLLFVDIATAQSLFDMPGKLTRIDLVLQSGEALDQLKEIVSEYTITDALRRNHSVTQMTAAFHTNLQAMSLLALLVGGFLIYNTVTLSVLQRRRLFGLLRVAGVTRGQLGIAIIAEVVLFAAIATVLGLLMGYVIGGVLLTLITRTINDLYFALGVQQIEFDNLVLLRAVLLGFAAAIIAALAPALEAARSPPATVLRRSAIESKTATVVSWLFVGGCLSLLVGLLVTMFSARSLIAGFGALFIIVLGYTLLIPALLKATGQSSARFARDSANALGRYPMRSLTANLSRSSVAVASLAVALSATAGVGIMIGSFRVSVADWLDGTLEADVYVSDSASDQNGDGFSAQTARSIAAIDGVSSLLLARFVSVDSDRQTLRMMAVETDVAAMRRFTIRPGAAVDYLSMLQSGSAIMVSEPLSYKAGLQVGDNLNLSTAAGARKFEVAAVFADYGTGPGTLVMDLRHYRAHWNDEKLSSVGVYLQSNAIAETVMDQIRALGREHSVPVSVRATGEIKQTSLDIFDRTFAVTSVLRWLTILVAFIGILSALMAQMLERSREFTLLHALGVTRGELRYLILHQTFLLGCVAGVLALPLGYLMSRLLVDVINRRSFGWTMHFHVPGSVLVETLVLAVMAALIAGLYPAIRISRARYKDLARSA